MKISELTHEQKIALVAVIEAIAMSDGIIEEPEEETISKIAEELGEETYRQLLNEADEKFPDIESLKNFLETITSQEAREIIYGIALEEAMLSPSVNHLQSRMLEWLRDKWNITVNESE